VSDYLGLGLGLGRLQESSGSGIYRGPLPANISSRACSSMCRHCPCHQLRGFVTLVATQCYLRCISSLHVSFSIDQVCSSCSAFSQAAVIKASATSAAVISSSPKGTALPARRSTLLICRHNITYMLGYFCAHTVVVLLEGEVGSHGTIRNINHLPATGTFEASGRHIAFCSFQTNMYD
jgi:hypothetical protein